MENKALEVAQVLPKEKLLEFLKIAGVAQKLTEQERIQFVEIAQAYQLNPFKREIYCNTYGEGQYRTTSIITGYEVYIKRAERTGKLNGWKPETIGDAQNGTLKGRVTIYRKDWTEPFVHEVEYSEVVQLRKDGQPNAIWKKMPKFMTKKVAIAQGFRLCFSDELGGMPYTADELPQEEKAQAVPAEVKKVLPETEKDLINNTTSEEELGNVCRELFGKYPAHKKELVELYNARLAQLQEAAQ